MGVFDKPPKAVTVHADWFRLHPTRPRAWWLEVGKRVKTRRIRSRDWDAVKAVCREVEDEFKQRKRP